MSDDGKPFPILRGGPIVWPAELKPQRFLGHDDGTGLQEYLERHRHLFPHLHAEVIEQWVYRHWEHSPYVHVPLSEMCSEKISWNSAAFLEQVGIGEDLSDEIGDSEVIRRHWERLLKLRPFKEMWEVGTWDFPPLVLHNEAGFIGASNEILQKKFWLIEGHKRYRGLNYLHYKGRTLERHDVHVMRWPGGLPS